MPAPENIASQSDWDLNSFLGTTLDGISSAESGSLTETVLSTETTTETSASTFGESLYEAGSFSGDSFSFASVVYNESTTSSSTMQSPGSYTDTDRPKNSVGSDIDQSAPYLGLFLVFNRRSGRKAEVVHPPDPRRTPLSPAGSLHLVSQ